MVLDVGLASYNNMNKMQSISNDEGVWNISELEGKKVNNLKQWGVIGSKVFKALGSTYTSLPPAVYDITMDNHDDASVFIEKEVKSDNILTFKHSAASALMSEVESFWRLQRSFRAHGFLHRRGYLLYGTQGTGKSSILWQVASDVVKRGGIVFVCDNPKLFTKGLAVFRTVEPTRPVVCVFEDIDAIIERHGESGILSLLDGENQVDHVINMATTNYPEKLDKRIVSRPRRFDRLLKIEPPSDDVRIQFLKAKLPKKSNMKEWVKKTEGLSFAALTECLISVLCLGNPLDSTIEILRDIESHTPKLSDFGAGVGFNKRSDDTFKPDDV